MVNKIKKVRYRISAGVGMRRYVQYHKLVPLRTATMLTYEDLLDVKQRKPGFEKGHVFYRVGSAKNGEHWKILLDTNTWDIFITIYHKN
jgi:hypothetical protein